MTQVSSRFARMLDAVPTVKDATERAALFPAGPALRQKIYQQDVDAFLEWDGAAWDGFGGGTSVTAEDGTTAISLAIRFGVVLTPEDFNAVGDGIADDRLPLQAALDALNARGGGILQLTPGKTYLLKTVWPAGYQSLLKPRSNIWVRGAGRTSCLKAGPGLNGSTDNNGFRFFGHEPGEEGIQRIDHFYVTDVFFDHNGLNNLIPAGHVLHGNQALSIRKGDDIRFEGNYCLNDAGAQAIYLGNGSSPHSVTNVRIVDNTFYGMGAGVTGNVNSPDHSTMFLQVDGLVVRGNLLINDAVAATTCTGIECHGSNASITDNRVVQYSVGFNAVALQTSHRRVVYAHNTVQDCLQAMHFWQDAGFTMDQTLVIGNVFYGLSTKPVSGDFVDLDGQVIQGIDDVSFIGNTFASAFADGTSEITSCFRLGRLKQFTARANKILGFPARGFTLGNNILTTGRLTIEGNDIEDCCKTSNTGYREGIGLNSATTLQALRVAHNTVRNNAVTKATAGVRSNVPATKADILFNSIFGTTLASEVIWTGTGDVRILRTRPLVVTLTDAATIAINCLNGLECEVTLTASGHVFGAPTGMIVGDRLTITVIQDGTGGRTVTFNAVFKLTWSDTGNTAGKRSTVEAVWNGTNWNQAGAQTPYV